MIAADFESALTAVATDVQRVGPAGWEFTLGSRPTVCAAARVAGDWVVLTTPAPQPNQGAIELLQQGRDLPAGVKVTSTHGHDSAEHRIECRLADCVADQCELPAALARLASSVTSSPTRPTTVVALEPPPALAEVCAASGWPFVERAADTIAIALAVEPSFQQAILGRDPANGVVRLRADLLATDAALPPLCAQAVGALLMHVAGVVLLVRAIATPAAPGLRAGFEVVFATEPDPHALQQACAALSVACRLCAAEAEVLAAASGSAAAYLTFAHPGIPQHPEGETDHDDCYDCSAGK
jgi:hypothetical protein